jgi:hypothetical protein
MALLTRPPDRRGAWSLALLLTMATLTGCMMFGAKPVVKRDYAFSHRAHIALDIECTDCHSGADSSDEPGMPKPGTCRICHADRDAEKPEGQRVDVLFVDGALQAVRRGALTDEVVFSHQRHVESGVACDACHVGIAENDDALALPAASMDACTQCHATRSVSNACATCHTQIDSDVRPPSHGGNWSQLHGRVCRAGADRVMDRCELCHRETDCASCHMTVMPPDHTNQWRRVGHGVSASLDRDRCATCHRPDSCASCHANVQPLSHTGQFGSPRNTHCLGCHEPLRNEGCSACHASTPSHALAKPKPPGHTPSMNCRQCHIPGGTQPPMPHVDNGQNCNDCHH